VAERNNHNEPIFGARSVRKQSRINEYSVQLRILNTQMMSDKKHNFFCDGGLGNRFASLFLAAVLIEKFRVDIEISWPVNNWCGAEFTSLFESEIAHNNRSLNDYACHSEKYHFVMHENQLGWEDRVIYNQRSVETLDTFHALLHADKPIFYYANQLPHFLTFENLISIRNLIRIRADLLDIINSFVEQNKISTEVIGLHIRKTDFFQPANDWVLHNLVKTTPHQRYLVCTDDADVQNAFSVFPNCVFLEKISYPAKMLGDLEWNSKTTDSIGREFNFNITRSQEAVIAGLLDLCVLSRTTILNNSSSSFLFMARLFQKTGLFQ